MRNGFCTLIFVAFLTPFQSHAIHVVIDPGHGGTDKGANLNGRFESEITLHVAKKTAEELRRKNGVEVTLTRAADTFLTLEERAKKANETGDLFLSIHVNSSPDHRARGHEIYIQNQLPADEEALFSASRENQGHKMGEDVNDRPRSVELLLAGKKFVNSDVKAIIEDLFRSHRLSLSAQFAKELFYNWQGDNYKRSHPIRQAPFFVISNVSKPSVLVEIGYLSNAKEAEKLGSAEYQAKIANGIVRAIMSFKDFMDKNPKPSLN